MKNSNSIRSFKINMVTNVLKARAWEEGCSVFNMCRTPSSVLSPEKEGERPGCTAKLSNVPRNHGLILHPQGSMQAHKSLLSDHQLGKHLVQNRKIKTSALYLETP